MPGTQEEGVWKSGCTAQSLPATQPSLNACRAVVKDGKQAHGSSAISESRVTFVPLWIFSVFFLCSSVLCSPSWEDEWIWRLGEQEIKTPALCHAARRLLWFRIVLRLLKTRPLLGAVISFVTPLKSQNSAGSGTDHFNHCQNTRVLRPEFWGRCCVWSFKAAHDIKKKFSIKVNLPSECLQHLPPFCATINCNSASTLEAKDT